jgi:hypothetical protein
MAESKSKQSSPCDNAIANIFRKRIRVGDRVFIERSAGPSVEGVVQEINISKCYAVVNVENVALFNLSFNTIQYVELLCVPPKSKCEKKKKTDSTPPCDSESSSCADVNLSIWRTIDEGTVAFVSAGQGASFIGTIEEISFKYCFSGVRTASGITYSSLRDTSVTPFINGDKTDSSSKSTKSYHK